MKRFMWPNLQAGTVLKASLRDYTVVYSCSTFFDARYAALDSNRFCSAAGSYGLYNLFGCNLTKKPAQKRAGMRRFNPVLQIDAALFNFAFFELYVLAGNRVVLFHHHFLSDITRVLLCDIEEARTCGRIQANLDGRRLGHDVIPYIWDETRTRLMTPCERKVNCFTAGQLYDRFVSSEGMVGLCAIVVDLSDFRSRLTCNGSPMGDRVLESRLV